VLEAATGSSIKITESLSLHPITLVVIVGIALQGLAECFLSPKFLEYASKQAPNGEVGLYLGYQHLTTCFAWLFGFVLSGHLLDRWCPNPVKLSPEMHEQWLTATTSGGALPEVYAHAHYIWYVYAAIGAAAFVALMIFKLVTNAIDRGRGSMAG
ncbi:MAG: MFS transporter, partial [Planctomycetes bacterium]|nr:MFS transporter [Planctomycetota bacterium]